MPANSSGHIVSVILILLFTVKQSVIGLLQLFGICSSNSPVFTLTGTFNNPGPFGGFVAIGMAISAAWLIDKKSLNWHDYSFTDKIIAALSLAALLLGSLVLPSTLSRGSWVALATSILILITKELNAFDYLKKHRLIPAVTLVFFIVAAGVFLMKKQSALGRLHIWRIECLAISEKPLTGHGHGSAQGVYGRTQAVFFQRKKRNEQTIRIAGCPEYSFNEYLNVGVEHGIPAMVLFVASVVISIYSLIIRRSPLGYGLIVLAIFSLFSYPLSLWQFKAIGILIFASAVAAFAKSKYVSQLIFCGSGIAVIFLYVNMPEPEEHKFRQLYSEGYNLHLERAYEESNRLLREGAAISSDPMFHNIIGKNLEAMGDYEGAEREFLHAHFMIPCRLYPLVLLMEMYDARGNQEQALAFANMAIGLPVNDKNPNMVELHQRAEHYADSLSSSSHDSFSISH